MILAIEVELDYEAHMLYLQMGNPQRRCRRGRVRQDGTRLQNQRQSRSSSRHGAQEELVRSSTEPEELVRPMHVEVVVIGFRPLKSDPCIMYIYVDENGFAIVTL